MFDEGVEQKRKKRERGETFNALLTINFDCELMRLINAPNQTITFDTTFDGERQAFIENYTLLHNAWHLGNQVLFVNKEGRIPVCKIETSVEPTPERK